MDRPNCKEEASTMADRASSQAIGGRNSSPDSVIYTVVQSNGVSLFSSASASVDRCSFASDVPDRDSLSSEIAQHLAEHERCGRRSLSGPILDLEEANKDTLLNSATIHLLNNATIATKVQKLDDNKIPLHFDEEVPSLDSARSSFSLAHKDFQERRMRSDMPTRKSQRRRPASLDLYSSASHNASSSPRFGGGMPKNMSNNKSWKHDNYGWSSERVALPHHSAHARKQTLPFNNCKTLPSKWEDAERWIFSPVITDGFTRPLYQHQPQRQLTSKSGPIAVGPPGIAYYSLYSPAIVMRDRSNTNELTANSPFSTGVMMADSSSVRATGKERSRPCIGRSASVHGCTELVCRTSGTSSGDEEVVEARDTTAIVRSGVARRDMATQMSPSNSSPSSPRRRPLFSMTNRSIIPITEVQSSSSSPPEVRDVQVDERITIGRWSKKSKSCTSSKGSGDVDSWKLRSVGARSSPWELSDRSKALAKATREEAKIIAWENLQKARAEAAILKLEMKLEKKRSTSMEKIMNKLRSAQKKAQEKRSSVVANEPNQVSKISILPVSMSRTRQMSSLSGCFTCHAF